jgi:site-specific recombinase XerC
VTATAPKWRPKRLYSKFATDPNLRAVQLLLGHTKIESTVRYLGIDVDDALLIAEQVEI